MQETLTGATPVELVLNELRKMAAEADSIERRLEELVDAVLKLVEVLAQ